MHPLLFVVKVLSSNTGISLVPPQTPENIGPLVQSYLKAEFAKLNSKNTFELEDLHGGKPWVTDHTHWNFEAAKAATRVRFRVLLKDIYLSVNRLSINKSLT